MSSCSSSPVEVILFSETLNSGQMSITNQDERDCGASRWTPKEERVFIELMAEEVRKENRPITTFSKNAWNIIYEKFYIQMGHRYTPQQFKNKFNKLRRHFREFKKLRDVPTGFGWNSITKTVTAPKEVWDSYIKQNPYAKQFRNRGCPMFDELVIIYGDTTTKGENARTSTQEASDTNDDDDLVAANVDMIGLDRVLETSFQDVEEFDIDADSMEDSNRSRSRSRTPTSRRRKEFEDSALIEACRAFAFNQKRKCARLSSKARDDPFSISRCCEILSAIDDLSDEILKVAKIIQTDRNWREAFISVPANRRVLLLRSLE